MFVENMDWYINVRVTGWAQAQHHHFITNPPHVWLVTPFGNLNLTYGGVGGHSPTAYYGSVPATITAKNSITLHVEGFMGCMHISMKRCHRRYAALHAAGEHTPGLAIVLNTLRYKGDQQHVPMPTLIALKRHLAYHLCAGINQYIMYVTEAQALQLLNDPVIDEHFQKHVVKLCVVAELYKDDDRPCAWQSVLYSHALLAAWKENIWLFPIDMDEFMVFQNDTEKLADIIQSVGNDVDVIKLPRLSAVCEASHCDMHQGNPLLFLKKGFTIQQYKVAAHADRAATIGVHSAVPLHGKRVLWWNNHTQPIHLMHWVIMFPERQAKITTTMTHKSSVLKECIG